ncbi:MAG: serine hydrolase domain-containing protein [Chthoniobacterales bacterium]
MYSLQANIQELINQFVAEEKEKGIQVAVYVAGELVVNAWAGIANDKTRELVTADTLFPVFSTTKGLVATIINLLAERGQLSYDAPIADVWPEFSQNGKAEITVRDVLFHASGIPQMPAGIGYEELVQWERMCSEIARLEPLWKAGTRIEYHAMTFGWILGEVARRVDGRPFSQMVHDEICAPLGIETMFVGIPESLARSVARLEADDTTPVSSIPTLYQAVPDWIGPLHAMMNRKEVQQACIPASNGILNALSIARHYAALLPGGVDGVELLSSERVKIATRPQRLQHPETEDYPKSWGMGYQLGFEGSIYGPDSSAFGHDGYGGSVGFADPSLQMAVGITRNCFRSEETQRILCSAIRCHLA